MVCKEEFENVRCYRIERAVARNKRGISGHHKGGYTRGFEVTSSFILTGRRFSFCVSGSRGVIAEFMHKEHLCAVALTSNRAWNLVLSACLLPPCVIAYCSSSTSRWIRVRVLGLWRFSNVILCFCLFSMLYWLRLYCLMMFCLAVFMVSLHGD